jgi:hypothetical protein
MTVKQLIEVLQKARNQNADIECFINDEGIGYMIDSVGEVLGTVEISIKERKTALDKLKCQCEAIWRYQYNSEADRLHVMSEVLKDCDYQMTQLSDPPTHVYKCKKCEGKVHIGHNDSQVLKLNLYRPKETLG